jgi:hypothetical protein
MGKIKDAIAALVEKLRQVEKEEKALKKRREAIESEARGIQGKCPHREKKQQQGTFCYYCTECGKQV